MKLYNNKRVSGFTLVVSGGQDIDSIKERSIGLLLDFDFVLDISVS